MLKTVLFDNDIHTAFSFIYPSTASAEPESNAARRFSIGGAMRLHKIPNRIGFHMQTEWNALKWMLVGSVCECNMNGVVSCR